MNNILHKINNYPLFKTGVNYSISATLYSVVGMIAGFLSLRWLDPDVYGVWQSFTIILSYLPILQLGIQSGLNIELPIMLGKGEKSGAISIVSTGLFFALFLSFVFLFISIVVITILIVYHNPIDNVLGFMAISMIAIIQCYRLHYIATYRSASAFQKLSIIYLISSGANLLLIYCIYKYQYYGLLIYYVGSEVVATSLMWYNAPYRGVKPLFSSFFFKQLFKRGIFMTFVNQIIGIIDSLPKLLLLRMGGVIQVGLFAPALAIGTVFNLIPSQIAQFLQPQFGYKYGQTGNAMDMWRYLKTINLIMPICILPFSLLGWFAMPNLLELLFPKYLESLSAIRIMLIGFAFSSGFITRSFLITIKAYKEVVFLYLADLAIFIASPFVIIKVTDNPLIVSMSMGLTTSYFISYIMTFFVARRTIRRPQFNMGISV